MKIDFNSKTFRTVFSALMIALATVLSELTPIRMPFGGTVTPGSMVPLVILSQMYGLRWGIFSGTAYGLLQMLFGMDNFSYATSVWAVIAIVLFDYLVAYGAVGLSAVTRGIKNHAAAAALGAVVGGLGRFVCHFVSGVVVWGEWADVTALPEALRDTWLGGEEALVYSYSFFYNGATMLPEIIVTAALAAVFWGALGGKMTGRKRLPKTDDNAQ